MPELYLSRYLSPRFDIMLKNDLVLFRSDLLSDVDLANPSLNLRLKLSNETKNFRPYLSAGPGFLADNNESGLNFNVELGAKYYFTPKTAFYLDAGYINGIKVSRGTKEWRRKSSWSLLMTVSTALLLLMPSHCVNGMSSINPETMRPLKISFVTGNAMKVRSSVHIALESVQISSVHLI